MASKVNGFTVGYSVAGAIVLWSGIKGSTISAAVKSVLAGNTNPPQTEAITSPSPNKTPGKKSGNTWNTKPPGGGTIAGYKAFARLTLAKHGWTGSAQWSAFQNIVMAESGWNPTIKNPTSGAFGIAQALGHGNAKTTAPDGENNYGNFGTSNAICKLANEGNGNAQIEWMCNYIAQAYGDPAKAWAYHQANNSY